MKFSTEYLQYIKDIVKESHKSNKYADIAPHVLSQIMSEQEVQEYCTKLHVYLTKEIIKGWTATNTDDCSKSILKIIQDVHKLIAEERVPYNALPFADGFNLISKNAPSYCSYVLQQYLTVEDDQMTDYISSVNSVADKVNDLDYSMSDFSTDEVYKCAVQGRFQALAVNDALVIANEMIEYLKENPTNLMFITLVDTVSWCVALRRLEVYRNAFNYHPDNDPTFKELAWYANAIQIALVKILSPVLEALELAA